VAVFDGALDANFAVADFFDFTDVGDKGDAQVFGQFRPDLAGIAVNSLAAANNQVVVF